MNKKTIYILVGVVALGGIAFAGYKMWKNKQDKDSETDNFVDDEWSMNNADGHLYASGDTQMKRCCCPNGGSALISIDADCGNLLGGHGCRDCAPLRRFDGETEGDAYNESYGL